MMKRIVLSLLLALLASSCAVYAPKTAGIPRFEQQGDMQAAVALDATEGVAFSAAGAVTDHIGVQLSGEVGLPSNPHWDEESTGQYSVRPTVGYYYAFPCHLTLGLYAGTELAWRHNLIHYDPPRQEFWLPYTEYRAYRTTTLFGQFDLLWAPARWVDLGYRVATGNFHYDAFVYFSDDQHASSSYRGNCLLIEQTLQLRLGGPHLKALLSASLAQIPNFPQDKNIYYRPFTFGLGLTYHFKL